MRALFRETVTRLDRLKPTLKMRTDTPKYADWTGWGKAGETPRRYSDAKGSSDRKNSTT